MSKIRSDNVRSGDRNCVFLVAFCRHASEEHFARPMCASVKGGAGRPQKQLKRQRWTNA